MRIDDFNVYIVRLGNVYLVAMAYEDTGMCRLSESPYNALQFHDRADARKIAVMSGGQDVMFNPLTGRVWE